MNDGERGGGKTAGRVTNSIIMGQEGSFPGAGLLGDRALLGAALYAPRLRGSPFRNHNLRVRVHSTVQEATF